MNKTMQLSYEDVEILVDFLDKKLPGGNSCIRDIYCKLDDWRGETVIPVICEFLDKGLTIDDNKKCCMCMDTNCQRRCAVSKTVLEDMQL